MKLKRLVLDNFRSHRHLDISFENDVNVIVGDNGEGKTSVLDAIAQLFGRLLTRLPGVVGITTKESDLRIVDNKKFAPGMRIWMNVDVETEVSSIGKSSKLENEISASRSRLRDGRITTRHQFLKESPPPKGTKSLGLRALDQFADALVDADNEDTHYKMPLIVYYGTSRAVFVTPLRRRNFKTQFARFDSMSGALNSTANFKRVFEWFHAKETEEAFEQKRVRSFSYVDPELAAVRKAIESFFSEFKNPRTLLRPLRFVVDKKTEGGKFVTFDLNQLSDGYRTTLAMIADLACRMVEANPPIKKSNPLQAEAIVLIDEVDLHLHPKWQQTILLDLHRVFPNAQFIVTTHSAQVLTTVENRCIRKLVLNDDHTEVSVPDFSLGARSGQLLNQVQDVSERPKLPITEKLVEYQALVSEDKWDSSEAISLRKDLDSWAGNKESLLKKIDIDIKMRAYRRKRT